MEKTSLSIMTRQDFVYSRLGMSLVSAQRVEFITGQLLNYLVEFDENLYGITSLDFLNQAAKSNNGKKTLGTIFRFLKLNPKLVIEEELDDYLKKRNLLAHNFWCTFLKSESDGKEAVAFCYDFGRHSVRIESFFRGFLYFLALRHVKDRDYLDIEMKKCDSDFEYFLSSLHEKNLKNIED